MAVVDRAHRMGSSWGKQHLLHHRLPLFLQPPQHQASPLHSLIYLFNKHLCVSPSALDAPLALCPRGHLEWSLSTKYGDSYQPSFVATSYPNSQGVWREQLVTWFKKNSAYSIFRHLSQPDSRSQIKWKRWEGCWGKRSYPKLIVKLLGSVSDENGQKIWSFRELGSH